MRNFRADQPLKIASLIYIQKLLLEKSETEDADRVFRGLDLNNNGDISLEEFRSGVQVMTEK